MRCETLRVASACRAWQLLMRFFFVQREHLPGCGGTVRLVTGSVPCPAPHRARPAAADARLAEALACDASNVTGLVDRLESRGLVQRVASAERPPREGGRSDPCRRASSGELLRRMTQQPLRCRACRAREQRRWCESSKNSSTARFGILSRHALYFRLTGGAAPLGLPITRSRRSGGGHVARGQRLDHRHGPGPLVPRDALARHRPHACGTRPRAGRRPQPAEHLLRRLRQRRRLAIDGLRRQLGAAVRRPVDRLDRRDRRRAVEPERHLRRDGRGHHPPRSGDRQRDVQVHRRRAHVAASRAARQPDDRGHRRRSRQRRSALRRRARSSRTVPTPSAACSARPTADAPSRRCSSRTTTPAPTRC